MKRNEDNWWQYAAKRTPDKRPSIPAYKPQPLIEEKPSTIEVEESEGTDGSATIIQKVKRFWGL